jgi:hypothetical protein
VEVACGECGNTQLDEACAVVEGVGGAPHEIAQRRGVIHKIQILSPVGSILAEDRNGPWGEWTDPIGLCMCDG